MPSPMQPIAIWLGLKRAGKLKAVVTQNIDSLHEMAGSKKVLKLHGSADRNYCTGCQRFYDLEAFLALEGPVPHCLDCGKVVKPDVTLLRGASRYGGL